MERESEIPFFRMELKTWMPLQQNSKEEAELGEGIDALFDPVAVGVAAVQVPGKPDHQANAGRGKEEEYHRRKRDDVVEYGGQRPSLPVNQE